LQSHPPLRRFIRQVFGLGNRERFITSLTARYLLSVPENEATSGASAHTSATFRNGEAAYRPIAQWAYMQGPLVSSPCEIRL
jgi:hypothetical protein